MNTLCKVGFLGSLRPLWPSGLICTLLFGLIAGCAEFSPPVHVQDLGYTGHVNEHHVLIDAPADGIFAILTDFNRFPGLVPCDRIRVTKETPGPYAVGTVILTQTGYKIKVSWRSRVVDLEQDRRIVLQFQEGIFKGGYEIWQLQPEGDATRVSHTILYNVANVIYRVFWVLKDVESKHNILVEATLRNLKRASESGSGHLVAGVTPPPFPPPRADPAAPIAVAHSPANPDLPEGVPQIGNSFPETDEHETGQDASRDQERETGTQG